MTSTHSPDFTELIGNLGTVAKVRPNVTEAYVEMDEPLSDWIQFYRPPHPKSRWVMLYADECELVEGD